MLEPFILLFLFFLSPPDAGSANVGGQQQKSPNNQADVTGDSAKDVIGFLDYVVEEAPVFLTVTSEK